MLVVNEQEIDEATTLSLNFWIAKVEKAVSDARGDNPGYCMDCHDTRHCLQCKALNAQYGHCLQAITYQECAKRWLQDTNPSSWSVTEACSNIGIEHGYLLMKLRQDGVL